jgi:heme-degrading monooxygenase HmoA
VILEHALLRVAPGHEEDFEAAFAEARTVVAQAEGFLGLELWRGVEEPLAYRLLIRWVSVEAHTEGFRGSALYERWSELLRPHFSAPPEVAHGTAVPAAGQTDERSTS